MLLFFDFENVIFGSYMGYETGEISITVTDQETEILQLNQTTFEDGIFTEIVGAEVTLKIDVLVADGTIYPDSLALSWTGMQHNVNFESDADALTVTDDGVLKLISNYWRAAVITASTFCSIYPS